MSKVPFDTSGSGMIETSVMGSEFCFGSLSCCKRESGGVIDVTNSCLTFYVGLVSVFSSSGIIIF